MVDRSLWKQIDKGREREKKKLVIEWKIEA